MPNPCGKKVLEEPPEDAINPLTRALISVESGSIIFFTSGLKLPNLELCGRTVLFINPESIISNCLLILSSL